MINVIKRHFPENKNAWISYFKIFLPIIFGSMMFALNGVIDNFMVGHISQGQSALGASNSWTTILTGFFLGTAAAGSVAMAQFYHAEKYDTVRQVSRIRFLLSFSAAIILSIIAWSNSDLLIDVFIVKGKNSSSDASYIASIENARTYIKIIAIQWLLISISFNLGNQLRELGHGKITMFWGIGTLFANVVLNSILMYGFKMGVEGAAWASVMGRVVAITTGIVYIIIKKLPIMLNPLLIFKISKDTWKIFAKRFVYGISVFTVTFFIVYRIHFYSIGYPTDSLGKGVSGLSVVGLTGAIINVFTVVFNSLSAMAAVFVGSQLGKGNLKLARKYSDELKGFTTSNALVLSILLAIFGSLVPSMTFLSQAENTDNYKQLVHVSHSIFVIAAFFPMWIWFSTSYRNASTGGKGHWFSVVDWIIGGPVQLIWLAVIMLGIVPTSSLMQAEFAIPYAIFFLSDLLKLILIEILYYKYPWENSITQDAAEIEIDVARDQVDIENLHE